MESSALLIGSFVVYSLGIVAVGLWSSKRSKRTADDFVLANRELGPWAASLSASASSESGWVMLGLVGLAFTDGFSAFWIVPQNVLQRELEFASLAIRRLLAVAVSGAGATAMALWGAGVWSLVALTTVQSLVSIVVLWNASSWRPSRRFSWARIRSMQLVWMFCSSRASMRRNAPSI